ncbi:MAG: divalent cation tolerance protein CutA [Dehalococcoidia bacterium]|nr:divalent cation tolerance protein CutA [Dehalococcoidia bacterium]
MSEFVVALITAPLAEAQPIARALVERRLAACVNVIAGGHSIYRWQGEVQEAEEAVLIVKTRRGAVPHLNEALRELHSHDTPELIAVPIEDGSPAYLTWLAESVELPDDEEPYFH